MINVIIEQYIYKCWISVHGSLLCSNEPVSLCVRRNASVWFMTNKKRREWELKSCGFLVARQPQRSALEDLEPSPFILKASVTGWTLVWTHQCRVSEVFCRDRWQETLNMIHLSKFNKYLQMKINPTFSRIFFRNY